MTDCLHLEDGRTWSAANWIVGNFLMALAHELKTLGKEVMAQWVEAKAEMPGGLMGFDLRGIPTEDRESFWLAVRQVRDRYQAEGGSQWNKPEFYPGFLRSLDDLVKMHDSIERGEPPEKLNHYSALIDFDGSCVDYLEFKYRGVS